MNEKLANKRVLTGIKPSGVPHLGNYLGMLKQSIDLMNRPELHCFYFIADIHALNTVQEPSLLRDYSYQAAATWLALGIDPERVVLYRESDVPAITQLNCLLAPVASKSLLNQAHAYKAITAKNRELGKSEHDIDEGVSMGLFNYPLLMAADILAFDIDLVPVGKDQVQHVEIARDLARRFNVRFGEHLKLPQAVIEEQTALVPGLDGRKMSKSYDNVIPLFQTAKAMEKSINRIVTDTSPAEAPKDPNTSTLFALYQGFASPEQVVDMEKHYTAGVGWGYVKKELLAVLQERLSEPYRRYQEWMNDLGALEEVLQKGSEKANAFASTVYIRAKAAVGL